MNGPALFTLFALIGANNSGIIRNTVGDEVVYTHSTGAFVALFTMGLIATAAGLGLCWWAYKAHGRVVRLFLSVTFIGVCLTLASFNMGWGRVRLTPTEVEISSALDQHVISIGNIKKIEIYAVKNQRWGGDSTHYKFCMLGGEEYDFTDSLVAEAVDEIRQRFRQSQFGVEAKGNFTASAPPSPALPTATPPPPLALQANVAPPTSPPPSTVIAAQSASNAVTRRLERTRSKSRDANQRPPAQRTPTSTAIKVTAAINLRAGMPLQALWGNSIFRAEVVDIGQDDQIRVHYVGWSNSFDEVLPRDRLWVEPADLAEAGNDEQPTKEEQQKPSRDASLVMTEGRLRTWNDATGKYRVQAELVELKDDKVQLKRSDGKIILMAVEKLSEADQEYVRSRRQNEAATN